MRMKTNMSDLNYPQRHKKPENQGIQKRDVNATNRAVQAVQLRAQKIGYVEIAQRCGYGSAGAAHKAVMRELQRIVVTNVEELRREESALLDTLHNEVWHLAMDKKNKWRLNAVDRMLAISEARRRLFGLDAKNDDIMAGVTVIREYGAEVTKV